MKKIKILESAIIGFLIGTIASTYILYITSMGKTVGILLNTISLTPLLKLFPNIYSSSLTFIFIFYVLTFIIYGVIIGFFIGRSIKINILICLLILLVSTGVFFEQKNLANTNTKSLEYSDENIIPSKQVQTMSTQYFGTETKGDLNNDQVEDIAFILNGTDDQGNTEYYLSASLGSKNGHTGTNLIFIDQEIHIESISIENTIIKITYTDAPKNPKPDEVLPMQTFYAKIINNILEEFKPNIEDNNSTTTKETL